MLKRTVLASLAAVGIAGCAGSHDKVEVTILPDKYIVGSVTSPLATPVVDEVVRLKPREVHTHICSTTPPSRLLQFNVELDARLEARKTMSMTAKGC